MTFTHGCGVTLWPVNQVTPEGLPVLFINQRDGNWALYGEEIRRLGELLDQLGRRP